MAMFNKKKKPVEELSQVPNIPIIKDEPTEEEISQQEEDLNEKIEELEKKLQEIKKPSEIEETEKPELTEEMVKNTLLNHDLRMRAIEEWIIRIKNL